MGVISTTIKITDAFSDPLSRLASGLNRAQGGFEKMKSALSGGAFGGAEKQTKGVFKSMLGANIAGAVVSKGMDLAGSGIRSMVGELNEASTSWQTFEGNLHQIGESSSEIASAKKGMQQFAQQTIYSASDMASTYSQLAAIGIKNTGQLVKGFGGLAASAQDPAQAMKTLSEQATQMAAKPKVQWQDFKLMMEQAPAGMSAVAKSMGTDLTGLIKKIQAGQVASKDFLDTIAKTGTNATFSKMATQYKTVGQAAQGLKETLANGLQPAFDKIGKVGIDWVSNLTDRLSNVDFSGFGDGIASALSKINIDDVFNGIGSTISNISNAIGSMFNGFNNTGALNNIIGTLKNIGSEITNIFSQINGNGIFTNIGTIFGNIVNSVLPVVQSLVTGLGSAFQSVLPMIMSVANAISNVIAAIAPAVSADISLISSAISTIAPIITSVFSSIASAIMPMVSMIGSSISAVFNGLAQGLQPLANAFHQLISAAQPIAPVFSAIGQALLPLVSGPLMAVAVSIGVVVDALTSLISIGAGVYNAINMIVQGFHALGDALSGNFSGAKKDIEGAKSALEDMKNSFGNVGNAIGHGATANIMGQFSQIGSKAKSTAAEVNGIKMSPQVDVAKANSQIANLGKNAKVKTKISPEIDIANINKKISQMGNVGLQKSKLKLNVDTSSATQQLQKGLSGSNASAKIKVKADTSGVNQQLSKINNKQLPAPKFGTPKMPTPKAPHFKQIPAPKVGTPKVGTPKTPHLNKIPAPKVGTPKVGTPKMPHLNKIPAPKVGTPKIPTPKTPHLKTIPAPKVARPNMSGVISAVSNGMNRAVAAARSKSAALADAVRSAVNQAASAGRAAAGQMQSVGAMIGAGLAAGMRSQIGAVAAAADALVAQANKAARAKAQIHSPSRLFAEVGSFIGQGMAVGMNSTLGLIGQSSEAMINSAYPNVGTNEVRSNSIASSNSVGSSLITPNSATNTTNYYGNGTTSSNQITVAQGAIVINSSGNPEEDANAVLNRLEDLIFSQKDKALG